MDDYDDYQYYITSTSNELKWTYNYNQRQNDAWAATMFMLESKLIQMEQQVDELNDQLNCKSCTKCPVHKASLVPKKDRRKKAKPVGRLVNITNPFEAALEM